MELVFIYCYLSLLILYFCYYNTNHLYSYIGLLPIYYSYNYVKQNYNYICNSIDEERYTISNLVKSIVLLLYVPSVTYLCYLILNNRWDNQYIVNMGILYSLPDIVSLFMVNKMSLSTFIHHSVVFIISILCIYIDFTENTIMRVPVIYGLFSTYSYLVNAVLTTRYIKIDDNYRYILIFTSLYTYLFCCFLNWSSSIYMIYYSFNFDLLNIIIILMIISLIYDDINLIKWLHYKSLSNCKSLK